MHFTILIWPLISFPSDQTCTVQARHTRSTQRQQSGQASTYTNVTKISKFYLHVVKYFEERECHSTSYNHFVYFVQQILNQQNLVLYLRADMPNTANSIQEQVVLEE